MIFQYSSASGAHAGVYFSKAMKRGCVCLSSHSRNFVRSLKFFNKNNTVVAILKSLEIRPLYHKLNSRKQRNSLGVFHRNYPYYSNDQR